MSDTPSDAQTREMVLESALRHERSDSNLETSFADIQPQLFDLYRGGYPNLVDLVCVNCHNFAISPRDCACGKLICLTC